VTGFALHRIERFPQDNLAYLIVFHASAAGAEPAEAGGSRDDTRFAAAEILIEI
jgi:hypothetical protein